jgi:hypothetical protein
MVEDFTPISETGEAGLRAGRQHRLANVRLRADL